MGFEELAALKQQLSKRAQAAKRNGEGNDAPDVAAPQPGRSPAANTSRPHAAKLQQTQAKTGKSAAPAGRKPAGGRPEGSRQNARADSRPSSEKPALARPVQAARPEKRHSAPVEPVVITIGQLQRRFPKAFPKSPAPKVPLKLGISKDILANAEAMSLTEPELLEAIKVWCQGSRYWASMTKGAVRVDLNGEPDGVVTPEQAARARSLSATHRRGKRPAAKKDVAANTATNVATNASAPEAAATTGGPIEADVPNATAASRAEADVPNATPQGSNENGTPIGGVSGTAGDGTLVGTAVPEAAAVGAQSELR